MSFTVASISTSAVLGGDKGSQSRDIKRAKESWDMYVKETKHDKA